MSIVSAIRKRTLSNQPNIDFEKLTEDVVPEFTVIPEFDSISVEVAHPEKGSGFPTRFVFTLLGFLGFFNTYTMRFNLSVAMVAMVKSTIPETDFVDETPDSCSELIRDTKVLNGTMPVDVSIIY
nr:uncharacterized protein LOC122272125 isoform X2 [Parasteatoda tepidariorum]